MLCLVSILALTVGMAFSEIDGQGAAAASFRSKLEGPPTLVRRALENTQLADAETFDAGSFVGINHFIDDGGLAGCRANLVAADNNTDLAISSEEFALFVSFQSDGGINKSFRELGLTLITIYYAIACSTCYDRTKDDTCCVGGRASINISPEDAEYEATSEYVCSASIDAISDIVVTTNAPVAPPSSAPIPSPVAPIETGAPTPSLAPSPRPTTPVPNAPAVSPVTSPPTAPVLPSAPSPTSDAPSPSAPARPVAPATPRPSAPVSPILPTVKPPTAPVVSPTATATPTTATPVTLFPTTTATPVTLFPTTTHSPTRSVEPTRTLAPTSTQAPTSVNLPTSVPTKSDELCVRFFYTLQNAAGLSADDIFNGTNNTLREGLEAATRAITIEILNNTHPGTSNQTVQTASSNIFGHGQRRYMSSALDVAPRIGANGAIINAIGDLFGKENTPSVLDVLIPLYFPPRSPPGLHHGRYLASRTDRKLVSYSDLLPPVVNRINDNPVCPQPGDTQLNCAIVLSTTCVILDEGDVRSDIRGTLVSGLRDAVNTGAFFAAIPAENFPYNVS